MAAPANPASQQVLVTGGTGFIGAHLVEALLRQGQQVTLLARPGTDPWRLPDDARARVRRATLDLGAPDVDPDALAEHLGAADVIYHLAAAGVDQRSTTAYQVLTANVLGTLQLLQLAQRLQPRCFVYAGSCFEYGRGSSLAEGLLPEPLSEYAASKSAGWLLGQAFWRKYDVPVVSVRPFTAYGPLEAPRRLVPHAILSALDERPISLTGGHQMRDFVYVADVVDGLLRAAQTERAIGRTLNLCTGVATSVRALVSTVLELTGSHAEPVYGALPYRPDEIGELGGDPTAAEQVLGWTAHTPLRDGLARSIEWFREQRAAYPAVYGSAVAA